MDSIAEGGVVIAYSMEEIKKKSLSVSSGKLVVSYRWFAFYCKNPARPIVYGTVWFREVLVHPLWVAVKIHV